MKKQTCFKKKGKISMQKREVLRAKVQEEYSSFLKEITEKCKGKTALEVLNGYSYKYSLMTELADRIDSSIDYMLSDETVKLFLSMRNVLDSFYEVYYNSSLSIVGDFDELVSIVISDNKEIA